MREMFTRLGFSSGTVPLPAVAAVPPAVPPTGTTVMPAAVSVAMSCGGGRRAGRGWGRPGRRRPADIEADPGAGCQDAGRPIRAEPTVLLLPGHIYPELPQRQLDPASVTSSRGGGNHVDIVLQDPGCRAGQITVTAATGRQTDQHSPPNNTGTGTGPPALTSQLAPHPDRLPETTAR